MSFLARLSARALPALSRLPAVMPKGLAARQMAPVYRDAVPPEEEADIAPWRAPTGPKLRRAEAPTGENHENDEDRMARAPAAAPPEGEPEVQPARLRRAPALPPDAEAEPARLHRAPALPPDTAEEPVAPLRRAEAAETADEAEEADEEPMRTLRRAEELPLDDGEKPLRQPFQADLVPGAMPGHPDLADQEEPSNLQALRRDVAPPRQGLAGAAPLTPAFPPARDPWLPRPAPDWGPAPEWAGAEPGFASEASVPEAASAMTGSAAGRAQVVIDQLDVLIHEPAAAAPARLQADHGRLMRARYLRRL